MKKTFFAVILACLATALSLTAVAFAQEPSPEPVPPVPYECIHAVWAAVKATPIGVLMALVTSLAGYLSKTPEENFRLENFAFTGVISFLIGFLTVYGGWSYTQIELWLANGFLTWYIWKVAKIIAKKFNWTKQSTPIAKSGSPTQLRLILPSFRPFT
jgi:hypothetical protein